MNPSEKQRVKDVIDGLLEIAQQAMPDTFFTTDSRVNAAHTLLNDIAHETKPPQHRKGDTTIPDVILLKHWEVERDAAGVVTRIWDDQKTEWLAVDVFEKQRGLWKVEEL